MVHTDSLTIVNQFQEMQRIGHVQVEWTHTNWWGFLCALVAQRQHHCEHVLQVVWCPAHLLEDTPVSELTDAMAHAAGSNKQDIILNRRADLLAKQQLDETARLYKHDLALKENDVFARQLWLTKINKACRKPDQCSAIATAVACLPEPSLTPRQKMAMGCSGATVYMVCSQ